MLKIGLDCRVLYNDKTGIGRYTLELYKELIRQSENTYLISNQYYEWAPKERIIYCDLPISDNYLSEKILDSISIGYKLNVLFSSYYSLPISNFYKSILVVHDLIPLKKPELVKSERTIKYFQNELSYSIKNACKLIAISENTRNDLSDLMHVDKEKILISYPGISKVIVSHDNLTTNISRVPYLLSLNTIDARKNIDQIVHAFNEIKPFNKDLCLYIIGKEGSGSQKLYDLIDISPYKNFIKLLGFVDEDKLAQYISEALFLVYIPSYEGFGLPLIEAMCLGTPVICSNISTLKEVAKNAALYCNPENVNELAMAMQSLLSSRMLRDELIQYGFERSENFSWKSTAENILRELNS